jgi:NAD(P)-dependent dehydrogenase (short-subunit alcohol dehydrogenase family)
MDIPPVEPGYVSDAMVYLCGPSGRYLTGITLPVDGGLNLR